MHAEELLVAALRGDSASWPLAVDATFESTVIGAAHEHGVAALLTTAPAIHTWPDSIQRTLRDMRRDDAVIEALRGDALRQTLTALRTAGVRCVVFKGAQLAFTHYSEPWLRPRVDTDLLIAPSDRDRADALLRAIGYATPNQVSGTLVTHQVQYERHDRFGLADKIDLHWKISNAHLFADVLTFEEMIDAAQPIPQVDGAYGPSAVHALLLACVHRVVHHQNSDLLIWLYDIHLLAEGLDSRERGEFAELARRKRVRSICSVGLGNARRLFADHRHSAWFDELTGGPDPDEPSAAFLQHGRRRIDILLSDLQSVGGITHKARLLREHLFPPAEFVRKQYGADTPLFFAYVDRIVSGVAKWFRPAS